MLKAANLLKVTLLHGCFHISLIAQMVPNRAKHHISISDIIGKRMFQTNRDHWLC